MLISTYLKTSLLTFMSGFNKQMNYMHLFSKPDILLMSLDSVWKEVRLVLLLQVEWYICDAQLCNEWWIKNCPLSL